VAAVIAKAVSAANTAIFQSVRMSASGTVYPTPEASHQANILPDRQEDYPDFAAWLS